MSRHQSMHSLLLWMTNHMITVQTFLCTLKFILFIVNSHQRTGPLFTFFDSNLCCFSFQENGLSFSLEAVKRLHELAESNSMTGQQSPRFRPSTMSLCADPMLPQEFLPLCRQRGASASLARLGEIIKYWAVNLWEWVNIWRQIWFNNMPTVFLYFSYGSIGCLRDLCLCCLYRLLNKSSMSPSPPLKKKKKKKNSLRLVIVFSSSSSFLQFIVQN